MHSGGYRSILDVTRIEALHTLGLNPTRAPTPDEIKAAWRAATLKHHPDLDPDDPTRTERFQRIEEAYSILTGAREADPEPSSRPAVDLSRVLLRTLEVAGDPKHKGTLADLLGDEDTATALSAGARAFLRFAKGVK